MKVNAQVTAVISILELIGNVTYVIHVILSSGPSFGTFVHGQIPYMIVLPYAFLMNTSHNKNRIVENGWNNVLRNIIGRFHGPMPNGNNDVTPVVKYENKRVQRTTKNHEGDKDTISISTTIPTVDGTNSMIPTLNSPFYEKTSLAPKMQFLKRESKSIPVILNPNDLPKTDGNQLVVQNLLYFMTENIENEERYIRFFKKLLIFEDSRRNGKSFSEYEVQEEVINCVKNFDEEDFTKGNAKDTKTRSELLKTFENNSRNMLQGSNLPSTNSSHLKIINLTEGRARLRIEILNQLSSLSYKDETYKALLEDLIDLEESFVHED